MNLGRSGEFFFMIGAIFYRLDKVSQMQPGEFTTWIFYRCLL